MDATATIDHSTILASGNRGAYVTTLRLYFHPVSSPPCAAVVVDYLDISPFCDDIYDDVVIVFETFWGDPCGSTLPDYQDWKIDNIMVWGQDRIAPSAVSVTTVPRRKSLG